MKHLKLALILPFTTVLLSACVVAPPTVRPVIVGPAVVQQVYVAPPGVVYVAPVYAMPAPGYAWAYQGNRGWGWHHPSYGWHRGWRR